MKLINPNDIVLIDILSEGTENNVKAQRLIQCSEEKRDINQRQKIYDKQDYSQYWINITLRKPQFVKQEADSSNKQRNQCPREEDAEKRTLMRTPLHNHEEHKPCHSPNSAEFGKLILS